MSKNYKTDLSRLTKENKKIIGKMKRYLGTRHINEVAFDSLMSDIVGMALESQSRGEPFEDTVGMDYEVFCKELVANCPKQGFFERFLEILQWFLWCGGCLVPALYLFSLIAKQIMLSECDGLYYITPIVLFLRYCFILLVVVLGGFFVRRFAYGSQSAALIIYIAAIIISFFCGDYVISKFFDPADVIRINVPLWTALFFCGALLLFCLKRIISYFLARKSNKAHHN